MALNAGEPVIEMRCVCGNWHARTGLSLFGAEIIACPHVPDDGNVWDLGLPGQPEYRVRPR